MFVLLGDKGRDHAGACARREESLACDSRFPLSPACAGPGAALQVVILHHMLSKASALVLQEGARLQQVSARDAGRMYLAHA